MRTARLKVRGQGAYYHLTNRIGGPTTGHYPFTDLDKEYGFKLVQELNRYFLLEVISCCWMGNHVHVIVWAPAEPPSLQQAADRHNAFYGPKRMTLDPVRTPELCQQAAQQMVDISQFMSILQQRYSCHINRTHQRRGRLWADRFKSSVLEGETAFWACVKYVELNPVRAGLVTDSADYRWSSWGRYCGSSRHPFAQAFVKHLKRALGSQSKGWKAPQLYHHFHLELVRTIAGESGIKGEELQQAIDNASKPESMPLHFLHRTRHWSDGAILGSKSFVQSIASQWPGEDPQKVKTKRLARGHTQTHPLYAYRYLS